VSFVLINLLDLFNKNDSELVLNNPVVVVVVVVVVASKQLPLLIPKFLIFSSDLSILF
jgi:hypothetical protein